MKKNNKSKRSKLNRQKRIRHHKKNKNNIINKNKGFINDDNIQKAKDFASENIEKAKDFANENIEKAKDAAIKSFEKAKDFTSDNIDKFQKYLDEKDVKGKIKNIADTSINTIKEHSKRKYPTRVLKFFHRYYMLTFIILFVLSMLMFRNIYLNHNMEIERRLNYSITNYSPSLENIIIAKEDYYTNMLIRQVSSNKTATNHIILKSSSIEDLQNAFAEAIDSHTKNLQISMSEIVKSSSDTLNFWFAFISVVMIVFSFAGAFVNNNILNEAREQLSNVEKEAEKSLGQIKVETDKIIEENNKNVKINSELNLGYQAHQNQKYKEAIDYFTKVIELDDKNVYGYFNRAKAKAELKRYEEAIKDYDKAIELDNNYIDAYNNRGIVKSDLKQYEEAIKDYDKCIELDNNYLKAYNNRGVVKLDLKQYEEAIKDYDKCIELDDKDSLAYINRGLAKSNLQQYEEAIKDYDKAIELDNNNSSAYNNRGNAKADLKQYEEAIKDYDKAIELDNNNSSAYI